MRGGAKGSEAKSHPPLWPVQGQVSQALLSVSNGNENYSFCFCFEKKHQVAQAGCEILILFLHLQSLGLQTSTHLYHTWLRWNLFYNGLHCYKFFVHGQCPKFFILCFCTLTLSVPFLGVSFNGVLKNWVQPQLFLYITVFTTLLDMNPGPHAC